MIERWGIRARVTFVAFVPMLVVAALMTATHTSLRLSDLDETVRARAQAHARQLLEHVGTQAGAALLARGAGRRGGLRRGGFTKRTMCVPTVFFRLWRHQ